MTIPALVGAGLALAIGIFATVVKLDRDRAFYPTVAIVIALMYCLFAAIGGSTRALVMDAAGSWQVIMRRFRLIVLCVFLSGCATYRPATVPVVGPGAGIPEDASAIREGDTVRLVLHSGEKASGKVLSLDGGKLVLDLGGNYDHEERVIGLSEIEHAEFRNQSDGQIEGHWFLALGAALAVSILVTLRSMGY
jgi:hypothetical protein